MDEIREQTDDESPELLAARLRDVFQDEAYELVSELESALLELEKTPDDAELIGRVFRALHTIKGSGAACGLNDVSEFSHQLETLFDLVRKKRLAVTREIIDLILSAKDHIKAMFDSCYKGGTTEPDKRKTIVLAVQRQCQASGGDDRTEKGNARKQDEEEYTRLGEMLLDHGDLNHADLQAALASTNRPGELLVHHCTAIQGKIVSARNEQQEERDVLEKRRHAEESSSIRVATDKLDRLVDLVGELVTSQARLSQIVLTQTSSELLSVTEELERLIADIRDRIMDVRMVPIATTFGRFRRIVRDLSRELGKEVELTTEGGETELDKTVIDRLHDPLVHLIRNCIDHGIEPPSDRLKTSKPKVGTVHLAAVHSGPHVLIRITDDGAGIDTAAIRVKAVENGLITADAGLSERELRDLVFTPGLSTAKTVSGVSGRGVGMDVVIKAIDALRGSIEIETQKGTGTTITLKLPLTLAIIEGFLTKIGAEHFIFPLSLVEECVELNRETLQSANGRHLANVRGQIVPYIRLREHFMVGGEMPGYEQIVVTNMDGRKVGFVVDTVIGEHQTVIKSLGRFYQEVNGISGATILGDGTVALILDVPKIVRLAEQQETQQSPFGSL